MQIIIAVISSLGALLGALGMLLLVASLLLPQSLLAWLPTAGVPVLDPSLRAALAGAILLLGAAALLSCRKTGGLRTLCRSREDRQVFFLSAALTGALVLVAGLTAGAILAQNYLSSFNETLRVAQRGNTLLFQNVLRNALLESTASLRASRLEALLAENADEAQLREEVTRIAAREEEGLVSLTVFDTKGVPRAWSRPPPGQPALRVPIGGRIGGWLQWRDGWLLETRIPLQRRGQPLGEVLVEWRLMDIERQLDYTWQLGLSGEVLACVEDRGEMLCFPSRLAPRVHREAVSYRGKPTPMGLALRGEHGVISTRDYRGVPVVAAYGRVPDTPIGLVQKMNMDDLFAGVRHKMLQAFSFLLLLSLIGALLLGRLVRPIVQDLVKTRKQLAAVLDNVPSAIMTTDGLGLIESANQATETTFGGAARQLIGRPVGELLPDIGDMLEPHASGAATGSVSMVGRRLDGSHFPAEVEIGTLALDDRRQRIYIARDVSAFKMFKAVLRESEERLQGIAANIPGMVFQCVLGRHGDQLQFTYVSKGVERLLGIDAHAACADPDGFLRRLAAGEIARFRECMLRSAQAQTQWDWEGQIVTQGGESRWISLRATPRHTADGDTLWDGVVFNITGSKRNEESLERSRSLLRGLSAHMEAVREQERKRIASEVHDELGQTLTALRMNVSLLRDDLDGTSPSVQNRLDAMMDLVDRTIKTTRHVITSLRPPALDFGIAAALEWLTGEFSTHSGIPCRLEMDDGDIALDEDRAVTLFRIVQEALTNVARHARARSVTVRIVHNDHGLEVAISDDGSGFDPEQADGHRAYGLVAMRERVLSLQGRFDIDSGPGRGTCLNISIPLRADAPPRLEAPLQSDLKDLKANEGQA